MKRFAVAAIVACLAAAPLGAQTLVPLPVVNGTVKAFAAYGDTLYIAGSFTTVGQANRNGLAAIDLTTGTVTNWDPEATNGGNAAFMSGVAVNADGTKIYFSGSFDKVGAATRDRVAGVDSNGTLLSLAPTFNDFVRSVYFSNGILYAVGDFTMVNAATQKGFVAFDSTDAVTGFNPNPPGFNTSASFRGAAFSADGTKMYVSLGNSSADFVDTDNQVVQRRGFASLRLTDGLETKFRPSIIDSNNAGGTFAVAVQGSALYVAGPFDTVEGLGVNRLAGFNNEVFDPVFSPETGTGSPGALRAVAADDAVVYLAGDFDTFAGANHKGLVAVDATTGVLRSDWDAQSSVKFSSADTVLFLHEGKVFVGGGSMDAGTTLLGQATPYYGALTAIPEVIFTTQEVPTVSISGKKKITTAKSKLKIKGTATGSVTSVTYTVGKSKGTAAGTSAWNFTAKLKRGKNTVTVIARGPDGDSAPAKITVTLK